MATMTLDIGAVWGVGKAGRANGRPVLLHHGLIGDGTLGAIWQELGEAAGLEWVTIERPGYGKTPPMDMTQVADWPAMIAPLLDAIGIKGKFDVLGISAGSAYAYACAAVMPERIGRVAILSGVPFLHSCNVLDAYPPQSREAYARYATNSEADLHEEFRTFCQQTTEQLSANGDIDATRMVGALESILLYDAAGPAREARLQALDWGFEPAQITCPVDIWHFKGDNMVPFEAVQRSAELLPNVNRHYHDGDSHVASDAMLAEMSKILTA